MIGKLKNALVYADSLPRDGAIAADEFVPVADTASLLGAVKGLKTHGYVKVSENSGWEAAQNLYLSALVASDKTLDKIIEKVLGDGARLMVRCSASLEEVGQYDSKFGMTPVMYLHSLGLLENCTVAGGLYLDKDDLALMRQSNASVVFTLSDDYGNGLGIPALMSYFAAGVQVRLGTGSGAFNRSHDLFREAYLLKMSVCAAMNKASAVTDAQLAEILTGSAADEKEVADKIYGKFLS